MNQERIKLMHIFTAPQSALSFLEGQLDFMNSKGFDIHLVIPDDNYYSRKLQEREMNVRFHFVPFVRNISLFTDLKCLFRLIVVMIRVNPTILHLHTPKASLIGSIAAKITGKKIVIFQLHGLVSIEGNSIRHKWLYLLEKLTFSLSTHCISVSHSMMDFVIRNKYVPNSKIRVLSNGTINGIDTEFRFNPNNVDKSKLIALKSRYESKFSIGFVGRINRDKGFSDFLEVIMILKAKNLSVIGVVVGTNEMHFDFENGLASRDLHLGEDILYLGELDRTEIAISSFDVLLFPSYREGFGLVAAEAAALNVPVVGYDIPGVQDAVVNDKSGLLVEFQSFVQLSDAVSRYIDDANLKLVHGAYGRSRVVLSYNKEVLWNTYFETYNELLRSVNLKRKVQ